MERRSYPSPVAVSAKGGTVGITRDVTNAELGAVDVHSVGVLLVELGKRADAIRTEELILVQHLRQDTLQLLLAHKGQQKSVTLPAFAHTGDVTLGNVVAVLDEPIETFLEAGELVDNVRLKGENGVKRNQSDKRPHRHLLRPGPAVGYGVVVESTIVRDCS